MTLEITQEKAIVAYNAADTNGKNLLANLFGKSVFAQKITDRVKTFNDACDVLGVYASDILPQIAITPKQDFKGRPTNYDATSIIAYAKLVIIARALNEGWEPDWLNNNEYKWYPYFEYKKGTGLSFDGHRYRYAPSLVGSRLCFKSSELAEHAGKQFRDIYNDYMTIN